MKFSEKTISILKNFSAINPSILIKKGNILKTISPTKTVMAIAELEDNFEADACIFDLSRFLSVYSLYKEPNIIFEEKNFIIEEGKQKTKYVYANPSMIISPPEKDIKLPSKDVEVKVEWQDLQSVIKAAGVLQLPEIAFIGEENKTYLRAINNSNPSADTFGIELGETEDFFKLIIKTENLKLLQRTYNVALSSKGVSQFSAEDVTYFIAIESKSEYTKGE